MKVLATFNIKGGVGKTSSAVNLAFEAAQTGSRVLLWDLDPQGAATFLCRIKPTVKGGAQRLVGRRGALGEHVRATDFASLDLVPADVSLRYLDLHLAAAKRPSRRIGTLLEPLLDRYDIVMLDCPPGISLATDSVLAAADALLVPVVPSPLSARTLQQLADFLAQRPDHPRLLPYFSMVDGRNKLHLEAMDYLREVWPVIVRSTVPQASLVERMALERAPIGAFAPGTSAALSFRRLWAEISAGIWF